MGEQRSHPYSGKAFECPHCSNKSYFEIIAHAEKRTEMEGEAQKYGLEHNRNWDVIFCHNCEQITLYQETYFSEWDEFDYDENGQTVVIPGIRYEMLYPHTKRFQGTPEVIYDLYRDAKRLTPVDPASALVKLRRLLEAICTDKNANGDTLNKKITDLATKGVIPDEISEIAHKLRKFGNEGAHEKGGVTAEDVLLAQKLCEVLLEYIYEAPAMLVDLQERLEN